MRMRFRAFVVVSVCAGALFACGGPEPISEPPKPPPTLPPSLTKGGPKDPEPAAAKGPSPDVVKGKAALEQGNEPAAPTSCQAAGHP